ncbi:MAG TPA: hypothetical protein VML54_03640 [Candidatus Limnocylindrales bacterium]|nr:hypothetical protein [Candidatus Limnocylindrales bacterium]
MKTLGAVAAGALFAVLAITPASAQPAGTSNDPHHPAPPAGTSATPPPGSTPGMMGGSMPMMDMCHRMMAGTMAMPMMGGAAPADPKERVAMLQMRGEMMKAMGDIMMKHARRMQGTTGK